MALKGKILKILNTTLSSKINNYLLSIVFIAGTSIICEYFVNKQSYHVVSFILLFVVSILSTFMGIGPVLLASTLSAIVWNFFFIPPHHTLSIDKTEDILIFSLFFIIALVNGVLTTRVRRQEKIAREREKRTNALFQLTKELSKVSGIDDVLRVATEEIRNHFDLTPFFILQDGNGKLNLSKHVQKDINLSSDDYAIAELVFKHRKNSNSLTNKPIQGEYTFFPLKGISLNPGVIAIKQVRLFLNEQKSFWDTFIAQISNALEREFLGEMAQKVRFLDESDRLYKTLFNSISHELRIPIATIMGASDSILNVSNSENIKLALYQEIFTASLRLNRLIENLLNISRLESGYFSVRLDWCDFNDLINKVTEDLKDELALFSLKISIPDEMPLVKIDFGLMEQVLYNLLFNSTQYAPSASDIQLNIEHKNNEMIIELIDMGPGIPENELKNVFKKFFRVDGSKTGGLGLGLSIAKGFVEAHNGQISVENTKIGGAKFTIKIPTKKPDMKYLLTQQT